MVYAEHMDQSGAARTCFKIFTRQRLAIRISPDMEITVGSPVEGSGRRYLDLIYAIITILEQKTKNDIDVLTKNSKSFPTI